MSGLDDDRLTRLETIVLDHEERVALIERLLQEQAGFNRDLVRLVGSIDDRLGRIEEHLRRLNSNGQALP